MVLTYIYIFLENSIFAKFFLELSLFMSNTINKDDGILYFHDTEYTSDTIPSSLTLNKSVLGRYVTYYNTYLNLCEVQVHGKLAVIFCCSCMQCVIHIVKILWFLAAKANILWESMLHVATKNFDQEP